MHVSCVAAVSIGCHIIQGFNLQYRIVKSDKSKEVPYSIHLVLVIFIYNIIYGTCNCT